jgi:pilus assembly protein FimV
MSRFFRWSIVLAFVLAPASVSSLGLGDIKLNSYLNERLDAEINITVSGPEELTTLEVNVASREVFERFGIDRVDFLDDLAFTVERLNDGRAVVRVTSSEAIVEPFVTFLIEARSSGGRLLREYTVLLDPPLFLPEPEETAEAPEAPVRQAPSAGAIPRSEPAPAPASRAPVASPTTYGPVRRNETLWGIAEIVRPDRSISMNQAMISLFEANPDAFDGNINRLRAGATLRVPDFAEMTRLSTREAAAEVRRHNREWSQARAAPAAPDARPAPEPVAAAPRAEDRRLELVPPAQEDRTTTPSGASATTAPPVGYVREQEALNEELLAAVESMRRELEETRKSLLLKDEEIAALQDRLAGIEAGRFQPAPAEPGAAPVPPDAEVEVTEEAVAETPEEAAVAEPEPAPAEQEPAPATTPPPAQVAADTDEGGLFSSIWTWIVIVAVVLLGAAVVWRRRQEAAEEAYESWASVDDEGRPSVSATAAAAAAAPLAAEAIAEEAAEDREPPPREPAELEEEAAVATWAEGEPEKSAPSAESAEGAGEYAYPFEDTIAGATGINLEQSDPLAEADFHMAYGLYDQAADLIKKAIERDPERRDLRMKLLDILFVWGQQEEFLSEATAIQPLIGDTDSSDWERIAIMGRQICPDEDIFGAQGEAAVAAGEVDFDVGGGQEGPAESDGLDFDLSPTGEMPALDIEGVEESIAPESTAEVEIEDLGLDIDIEALGEEMETAEEEPEAAAEKGVVGSEEAEPVEETGKTEVLERPGDESETQEETGLTEVLERVDEAAEDETAVVRAEDLDIADLDAGGETKELPALDLEIAPADDDTAEVEALNEDDLARGDASDMDLDKTAELPVASHGPDGESLIEEVFGGDEAAAEDLLQGVEDTESTQEIPEVKLTDVTLGEVGTKLDLARAYIDMGDPDGARTILEEVVDEGNDDQQEEARQLLQELG